MNIKIKPISYSIYPEGDSAIFSERSTHVSIEDEGAGEFITITQSQKSISLDLKEFDLVAKAVKLLSKHIEE